MNFAGRKGPIFEKYRDRDPRKMLFLLGRVGKRSEKVWVYNIYIYNRNSRRMFFLLGQAGKGFSVNSDCDVFRKWDLLFDLRSLCCFLLKRTFSAILSRKSKCAVFLMAPTNHVYRLVALRSAWQSGCVPSDTFSQTFFLRLDQRQIYLRSQCLVGHE